MSTTALGGDRPVKTCKAPGSDCTAAAVDAVRIVSPVAMQIHGAFPTCRMHLDVFEVLDWRLERLTGAERAVLLAEVRPMVVGGVELEGWTESEKAIAWGRG